MSIAPLFQRFVDDELGRSGAFVSRVFAGTLQLLRDARDSGLSPSERGHYVELVAALQKQGERFQSAFIDSLRALVDNELKSVNSNDLDGDAKSDFGSLELMDESLIDADIEISRAMQLIDTTAEWEQRELQTFTSSLVGQLHVSAESNPFRPLVYATALWQAACAVATAQVQRATLLQMASGVAAGLLKNAWAAAATRLESQGIEPGTYRTVLPANESASSIDVTRPGALGSLLSHMPSGLGMARRSARYGGAPSLGRPFEPNPQSPAFEAALRRFDEALRQFPLAHWGTSEWSDSSALLTQHRAALVAATPEGGDREVIELLSCIFETILSDPALAPRFRPVIARMQVAALRVALRDPSMLETHSHEVWRVMDRIGELSLAYSQADDPRLVALQAFCQSLVEEIATDPSPDALLFRRALNRIDSFLNEKLQAERQAARAVVGTLELAEKHLLLERQLSQRLTNQMVPVRTTPGVRRFVTGTWGKVLAEAMLRFGFEAEPTQTYLKTVDDLLWSLQVPDHPQSRQRLVALLPVLLQRLRAGMELIALPRSEQQVMLEELMAIHADALRPGSRSTAPAPALSPKEIVQRMRDEVVTETSAGPRPFGDSVIDLSSMETVPAHVLATADDASGEPGQRIDRMRVGERARVFIHRRWSRCQLLWRSDHGLFFVFAGDNPTRTHSITRRALELLSGAGLLLPLEPKPLLQRAVDHLVREMSLTSLN